MTALRLALIGYGKMGKTIHQMATERGFEVTRIIDLGLKHTLDDLDAEVDVAIEFTRPESAKDNIKACLERSIPVVVGTTGWLQDYEEMINFCKAKNGSFFYASNYSIGVNILFALNRYLARIMEHFSEYDPSIVEIHHTQKLDAPSGTAITLAEQLIGNFSRKKNWVNNGENTTPENLQIFSERKDMVPGSHFVRYHSGVDTLEINHVAHNRLGFAAGALSAAAWLHGKKGCFGMKDLLQLD